MKTGYGRPNVQPDEMAYVGPGTPGGELLRRYWQPVALSTDAADIPKRIRAFGEELILYRDGQGRAGLLDEHCCHRGSSLYYGKVERDGIRCCYHGWLFDCEGRCLDQPCEPEDSRYKEKVMQPWYPAKEYGGLVFAYMGPPEKMPVFPRYDCIEESDGALVADDTGIGLGGPIIAECNWLQHYENVMDPFHVMILHSRFSGEQFSPAMAEKPNVTWEHNELGVHSTQLRRLPDGRTFKRITEVLCPNGRIVASVAAGNTGEGFKKATSIAWYLPLDDTHTRLYSLLRLPMKDGQLVRSPRAKHGGKYWWELTEEEHQRMPGDNEAITSQRPIAVQALDHLGQSDRGVIMVRNMLKREIAKMRQGQDPLGIIRDSTHDLVRTRAGNYVVEN
jgi:phenylpropionate dioxygenase-like ring-hydroxylating dioxygenase large terminal subunit